MKVLLIEVGSSTASFDVIFRDAFRKPSISTAYLAGALEANGYSHEIVEISMCFGLATDIDSYWERMEKIKDFLRKESYDILALSMVSGNSYVLTCDIAKESKDLKKDIPVITGGFQASCDPENLLKECPEIDAVVIGEGEKTLPELVGALNHNRSLSTISGICYIDKRNGKTVKTPPRLLTDLNDLPLPTFSSLRYKERYQDAPVMASRGCPYKCNFCSQSLMTGRSYRAYSDDKVIQIINKTLGELNVNSLAFEDPLFGLNSKITNKFLQRIIDGEVIRKFNYNALLRVDIDENDIEIYEKSGMNVGIFGLESGSPEQLVRMNKTKDPISYLNQTKKIMEMVKGTNLTAVFIILFAYPGETLKTAFETLNFIWEAGKINNQNLDYTMCIYTPYAGTASFNKTSEFEKEYGLLVNDRPWWKNRIINSPISSGQFFAPTNHFKYEDIKSIQKLFSTIVDSWMSMAEGIFTYEPGQIYTYEDYLEASKKFTKFSIE